MVIGNHSVNKFLYALITTLSVINGALLFVKLLGYNIVFRPLVEVFICILLSAIIIILTILSMKTKNKNSKTSSLLHGFLPVISTVFVVLVSEVIKSYAYLVLYLVILCCMALFFVRTKHFKRTLGAIYVLLITPIAYALYMMLTNYAVNTSAYLVLYPVPLLCGMVLLFAGTRRIKILLAFALMLIIPISLTLFMATLYRFPSSRICQSILSPNGHYTAMLWSNTRDSLGFAGTSTWITISHHPDNINLIFAELHRRPIRVYSSRRAGRWPDSSSMTLHWESDNLLRVDWECDIRPHVGFPLWFRYHEQQWVRVYSEQMR